MKSCPKCNEEFPDDDNYCDSCGLKLKKGKPSISHKEGFIEKNWWLILTIIILVFLLMGAIFIYIFDPWWVPYYL